MKIEELKYTLGEKNLAPEPREIRLGRRDLGQMIVIDRQRKTQMDSNVLDLAKHFQEGDVIILNNSKRVPGILKGTLKENGAQVELQFVSLTDGDSALCRIYPMHHINIGTEIVCDEYLLTVTGKDLLVNKVCEVTSKNGGLRAILKQVGLPINGFFSSKAWELDYLNPFYSNIEGSIESPLAGLHFTPELIESLESSGIKIGYVTLHSIGSWLPFLEEDIDDHVVFEEEFEMPERTAELINTAKAQNRKVIACGSTSLRTIESSSTGKGKVVAQKGVSNLFIKPGYTFNVVDHYFTNFHQYKTSLMVLDAAFCGKDLLMESIEVAKEREYLFYEFGDAVLYI